MKEVRIGFLGTGGIAEGHVRCLGKVAGVRVVGLCNRHAERARALNDKMNLGAQCFGDFEEFLEKVEMNALYVCLAPGAHTGQAEAAAARGLHLFLEKPIALDVKRARSIAAAVKKAGVKCQVGHHLRHAEPLRKLKAMIDDGSAGRPLLFQGRWFCNALHPAWWRDPRMGGGQLIEQAIHVYDLARYFMGDAAEASGYAAKLAHERFPEYRVDDTSAAVVRFRSGGLASICASNCAIPGEWTKALTVVCEKVTAEFAAPDEGGVFHLHGGKVAEEMAAEKRQVQHEQVRAAGDCYEEINRNFVAAIREGEPLRSCVEDGVKGLELVMAVAASSAAGGRPQRL